MAKTVSDVMVAALKPSGFGCLHDDTDSNAWTLIG